MLFSHRAQTVFSLDTYRNLASVVSATKKVRYPKGGTKIGSALRLVQNNVMRKARKAVAKVSRVCNLNDSYNGGFSKYLKIKHNDWPEFKFDPIRDAKSQITRT